MTDLVGCEQPTLRVMVLVHGSPSAGGLWVNMNGGWHRCSLYRFWATPDFGQTEDIRRLGTIGWLGAPSYPLDFQSNQPFDQRRQVLVQPFFQQRPHFLAHQILDRGAAAMHLATPFLRDRP